MKISLNRKEFLSVATIAKAFAPRCQRKPVLLHLKLSAGSDGATLYATSLDLSIRHRLEYVDVLAEGSALLPIQRLLALLKDCKDETVHLGTTTEGVSVRGDRSTAVLPGEKVQDFPPVVAVMPVCKGHVVANAAVFAEAIRRTIFACDTESSRYALGGLLLELDGNTLHVVGTDDRRMAHASVPVTTHRSPKLLVQFPKKPDEKKRPDPQVAIVPVAALKALLKALPKTGDIEISTHADSIYFHTVAATVEARGLQGRFPRWRECVPYFYRNGNFGGIELPVRETLDTIKAAAVAISYESRGVDFALTRDLLTLSAKSRDNGEASASLPIRNERQIATVTALACHTAVAVRARVIPPQNPRSGGAIVPTRRTKGDAMKRLAEYRRGRVDATRYAEFTNDNGAWRAVIAETGADAWIADPVTDEYLQGLAAGGCLVQLPRSQRLAA